MNSSPGASITPADLVAVALLCVAPLIRLALMPGPVGSDDVSYFHFSQRLLEVRPFDELHHHGGRLFFLILAGLPAALWGSIEAGGIVSILFMSLRDVLVTMFVRRETGAAGGAGAAAMLSVNALSSTYAGLFMPDALLSLMVFGSALLAFKATRTGGAAMRTGLVIAAGVAAGIAYSIKDTGILVIPPTVAWLLFQRNETFRGRIGLASRYCLAFIVVVAFEMAVYRFLSGDPLYRFHAISAVHNAGMGGGRSLYEFARHGYWNLNSVLAPQTGSLPVLVAAAVSWGLVALLRGPLFFFAGTGAFIGAYLVFGTSSFTRLVPLAVQDRYFEPLVPFVAVSIGALMGRFVVRRGAWVPAMAIATAVGVASFPAIAFNAGDVTFSAFGKNAAIALSAVRSTHPLAPILVSRHLRFSIEPFVSREIFDSLQVIPREGPLPSGYYMLHAWKDRPGGDARVDEIESLPIFLVAALDQRKIPLLWPPRVGPLVRATIWIKL